jgi:hypothetical protein
MLIPSASLAIILAIGGIVQFSEQVSSYVPWLSKYILQNSTAILLTISALLAILLASFLQNYKKISEELRAKDYSETRRKVILFLTPSPIGQFYLQHLSNLFIRAAHNADADMQIYIVMHCPAQAFQKNFSPELSLKLVKEFPAKIAGVFMIPSEPDLEINLTGIRNFNKTFPTVLLDVYPGTSLMPEIPPFIGGDEKKGGILAALLAENWLHKNRKTTGNILILKGRNSEWEMQRVQSFIDKIQSTFPDIKIYQSDELNYQRNAAHELVGRLAVNRYALDPNVSVHALH